MILQFLQNVPSTHFPKLIDPVDQCSHGLSYLILKLIVMVDQFSQFYLP